MILDALLLITFGAVLALPCLAVYLALRGLHWLYLGACRVVDARTERAPSFSIWYGRDLQ